MEDRRKNCADHEVFDNAVASRGTVALAVGGLDADYVLPAPPDLRLTLKVNGETRQDGRTGVMTWNCGELAAYIDARSALQPLRMIRN